MFKKARTIAEIYELVKDSDIVITADAPLKTALNKLRRKTSLGFFAATPREIASKFAATVFDDELCDEKRAMVMLSEHLNSTLRDAHYYTRKIFDIWKNVPAASIPRFLTPFETEQVWPFMQNLPTSYLALEKFSSAFYGSKKIAAVGMELFDPLDRRVLPHDFAKIDIFTEDTAVMEPVYICEDENDIVQRLAEIITSENQRDAAVVVNNGSLYPVLIKSTFREIRGEDISIVDSNLLSDHVYVRLFLSLIETGLSRDRMKLKNLQPYSAMLGLVYNEKEGGHIFSKNSAFYKNNELLCRELLSIENRTYENLKNWLYKHRDINLPKEFNNLLSEIGVFRKKITPENFADTVYFLENFPVRLGETANALLLADSSAAFINRPLCIYVGLDASWAESEQREWSDRTQKSSKTLASFQILMQQGEQRILLAARQAAGKPQIPSYFFNMIFEGQKIESFEDSVFSPQVLHKCSADTKKEQKPSKNARAQWDPYFSNSSFSSFYMCPRKFFYSRIVQSEDTRYMAKGTLLHEFAELYYTDAPILRKIGFETLADTGIEMYGGFFESHELGAERTDLYLGMVNIAEFIDNLKLYLGEQTDAIALPFPKKEHENKLRTQIEKISGESFSNDTHTEYEFIDETHLIKGAIDFIYGSRIIDYKSSSKARKPADVIKQGIDGVIENYADFQSLFYILALSQYTSAPLSFVYYFFLADKKEFAGDTLQERVQKRLLSIQYNPVWFSEYLAQNGLTGFAAKKNLKTLADCDTLLQKYFAEHPVLYQAQFDETVWGDIRADVIQFFFNHGQAVDDETLQGLIKDIVKFRKGGVDKTQALFFKDDLEHFTKMLAARQQEYKEFQADDFPCRPLDENLCGECVYYDMCLKAGDSDE